MALLYTYFLAFTALVAVNIIFADDSLQSKIDLTESASLQEKQAEEPTQERLFVTQITSCNYTSKFYAWFLQRKMHTDCSVSAQWQWNST
ncbi:uncharacterized protein [Maniola hyperantus]|uniref:uncharacterized protein n=1 Tax=Aphantopus hyperantus TaxID=2795564 RepID=UPI00374A1BE2